MNIGSVNSAAVRCNLPESLEGHSRHHFVHMSSDGQDEFEPRRSSVGVSCDERAQSVARVWPVVLSLAKPIYQDHAPVARDLRNEEVT